MQTQRERRTVCLVTSGNVASNPRLVKEARALKSAGFQVRVVAADIIPSLAGFDAEIIAGLNVKVTKISYQRPFLKKALRVLRYRAARKSAQSIRTPDKLVAAALHPLTPALKRAACRRHADLYIAHNLAALPAAGAAARRNNARLGFDAEDYHCGELVDNNENRLELRIRRCIESRWLAKCQHLTTSSPEIAEVYRRDYGVEMTPILNVFPLSEAPLQSVAPTSSQGQPPSLYWFSQTIGPGRGLEQVIEAAGYMRTRVELFLRGNPIPSFIKHLTAHAYRIGGAQLTQCIHVLPVAAPSEMARLAAGYDIGLAVEPGCTTNNELLLSNKIFTYLLGGVPILLSRTPAQIGLSRDLGAAALLIDLSKSRETALELDRFFESGERQRYARKEAWRLGRNRYNWDCEKEVFLSSVKAALHAKVA
jgi:hypothetical protein